MNRPDLFIDGKLVETGKVIGRGGEGIVYAHGDSHALKVYYKPDVEREAKLKAMIALQLFTRYERIAFPVKIVRDRAGKFVGFSMRAFAGVKPLYDLYAPGPRKNAFPKADFRFIVRSAANIATAVSQVHQAGSVIGDINHSGVLVSDKAMASLIDADSFQFDRFRCRVGTLEYTPPELQGASLDGILRTQQHDAFGLAVMIFQLLMMGRRPYVGRYRGGDMPMERAIKEDRFAYSLVRSTGMEPPPGACRLQDFPPEIAASFEAAFGADHAKRPLPASWVPLLVDLEKKLRPCSVRAEHFYPAGTSQCPWCRMEQDFGMLLFIPAGIVVNISGNISADEAGFDLKAIWAAIERIQLPELGGIVPPLPNLNQQPSEEAKEKRGKAGQAKLRGFVAIFLAVLFLGVWPAAWFLYIPVAWFGLSELFGKTSDSANFEQRYRAAEVAYDAALNDWRVRAGVGEFVKRKNDLESLKDRYADRKSELDRKLSELERNRRSAQLARFLGQFTIRRAKIRGIGDGRKATLASYGIDTAADVTAAKILRVPGFGEATASALLMWRDRHERRFNFSQTPTPADVQAVEQLKRQYASEAGQMRARLRAGPSELSSAAATINSRIVNPDPYVAKAYAEWQQLKTDLEYIGIAIPQPPPKVVSNSTRAKVVIRPVGKPNIAPRVPLSPPPAVSPTPHCPRCGKAMVKRQNRARGNYFWGCSRYPQCSATRPY